MQLIQLTQPTQQMLPCVPPCPQVLDEIATYRAPNMSSAGTYSLKRDMWRDFDPHFMHYGRRTLSRTWERALQVGGRQSGRL